MARTLVFLRRYSVSPTLQSPLSMCLFLSDQATTLTPQRMRAQDHLEKQANRRRRNHKFKVGDQVLLRGINITIPADSVRPADKLRHCWNYTRQSPSSTSCRRLTRFTTFSIFNLDIFLAILRRSWYSCGDTSGPHHNQRQRRVRGGRNLEYRFYGRKRHQFLVTWKGYVSEADEWVQLSNLESCMDMVTAFEQQHGLIFSERKE